MNYWREGNVFMTAKVMANTIDHWIKRITKLILDSKGCVFQAYPTPVIYLDATRISDDGGLKRKLYIGVAKSGLLLTFSYAKLGRVKLNGGNNPIKTKITTPVHNAIFCLLFIIKHFTNFNNFVKE